jgi:ankyrin repeat protein
MYPNPQQALPLPAQPSLEQYRKLAKELVKACRSGDPEAMHAWAVRWIERLAAARRVKTLDTEAHVRAGAELVTQFARKEFSHHESASCTLATAQFVIARSHGFLSWPKFANHLESLARAGSTVSAYEQAVEAIVGGDDAALARLLRKHPKLARARSTREHGATLLHYVSANGVEGYRQLSPKNSATMTRLLLAAGADVDATTEVYDGRCTALGLVATSSPPFTTGVQQEVIDVLLEHGARLDLPGLAGHDDTLIRSCLANGQAQAAEYLASRGAPVDLEGAAGLGRVDDVERRIERAPGKEVLAAFSMACAYGRVQVVDVFLQHGVDVNAEIRGFGEGHTALHVAAFQGHLDLVVSLLTHGADVHAIDHTWRTTPLTWALTGWSRKPVPQHYDIVAQLVRSGATVMPDVFDWETARDDPRMMSALRGART